MAALSLVAAACGGDDDDPSGQDAAADIDETGILKLPADMSAPAFGNFDPTKVVASLASPTLLYLYGTLLRLNSEGEVVPELAEEVEVVDASNLVVKLRPGLKFSDGTTLDAEALKFSWERLVREGQPGAQEAEFAQFETLTVASPTELRVKLKSPIAGAFYRLMRLAESAPVSPTAVRSGADFNAKPIGAGPFTFVEYIPGESVKLAKSESYWDADNIKLAGIEYVNVSAQAMQNAVRTNIIDFANLSAPNAQALQGVAGWDIVNQASNGVQLVGFFCKNRPPFDNLKVRQALNWAIDKDAMNDVIYEGKGEPMHGFNASFTPYYDEDLEDTYTHDPAKARSLLAEAGVPNLTFDILFSPGTDGQKGSEVLQQQFQAAGITTSLVPITGTQDFFPNGTKGAFYFFPLARVGLPKVTRTLVPGTFGNVCEWNDPELNSLVTQLRAVPEESDEGIELWSKISENGLRNALWLFGVFGTQPYGVYESRVGGLELVETSAGTPTPDIYEIYIKK
ncbi:MAG: ABC transporter substrate-binding protein [Acidimicrobiia bacterium]